jgi:hypothetical protein
MGSTRGACFSLLLLAWLSMTACGGQLFRNWGRIDINSETTRAFENHYVDTSYRYYISGSDTYPNAVIGLHRDYRLDSETFWREVGMTPAMMRTIVQNMKEKSSERLHLLYGFKLVDAAGKQVGVWYSIQTARTCIQVRDDGVVRIDTPDLDTYELLNGETGAHLENG